MRSHAMQTTPDGARVIDLPGSRPWHAPAYVASCPAHGAVGEPGRERFRAEATAARHNAEVHRT